MIEVWKPKRRWILARTIGLWLGLAALVAWPVTIFGGGVTLVGPGHVRIAATGGSLNATRQRPPIPGRPPGSLFVYRSRGALWLMPSLSWTSTTTAAGTTSMTELITPLWIWGLAFLAVARVGAVRCRPPREGLCAKCDYDLRGVKDQGRCPECGEATMSPA